MASSRCCSCNGPGATCSRCACVKAGRLCVSCRPQASGRCCNSPSPSPTPCSVVKVASTDTITTTRANRPSLSPSPAPYSAMTDDSTDIITTTKATTCSMNPSVSNQQNVVEVPPFRPVCDPKFKWHDLSGPECMAAIDRCYSRAVQWIPNLFKVPYGRHGKSFVRELTRLFRSYAENSAMECIALKAALLLPLLVLQKPHRRSKTKDHVTALERRLTDWTEGCLDQLLKEGEAI